MSAHNSDNEENPNDPVEGGSDHEMIVNPDDDSTNSIGLAASRILHLNLDSPAQTGTSSGSTGSTACTVKTPTASISPEGTSGGSGESKLTESEGQSLLDDQQMVEAILERHPEAESTEGILPVPEAVDPVLVPSGNSGGSTKKSKPKDPTQIKGDATSIKTVVTRKATTALKQGGDKLSASKTSDPCPGDGQLHLTTSEKPQAPVADAPLVPTSTDETRDSVSEVQLIPTAPQKVQDPAPDDSQQCSASTEHKRAQTPSSSGVESSAGSSIQSSIQGSTDRLDCSSSRSDDADVSYQTATAEEKRKLYSRRAHLVKGVQSTSTQGSVWSEKSVKPKPILFRDSTPRSDTSWDARTLDDDLVSVQLCSPEREASVLFPPEGQQLIHTDRDRRAISLPQESAPIIPHKRRAKTEPSDDSSSNPDPRPVSETLDDSSDDVSLSLSLEERERRAISLPPIPDVRSPIPPHEQRRAMSEVPQQSNLSASPIDVQLLSPPASDPSPVSQQQSVSSIGSSIGGSSDRIPNGVSHSVTPSLSSSDAEAMAEGYLGWIAQGGNENCVLPPSNLSSTSGSNLDPLSEQRTPSPAMSSGKESSSLQLSSLSSLSGPTCSDSGGSVPDLSSKDLVGKQSPGLQQSKALENVEGSLGTVPRIVEPELAKVKPQGKTSSGILQVDADQKEERCQQTTVPQGKTSSGILQADAEQKKGRYPQTSVLQGQPPTSETKQEVVPELMEGSPGAPENVPFETDPTKEQGAHPELQPRCSRSVWKSTERPVEKPQTPKRKRVPKKLPEQTGDPENPESPEDNTATKKKREDEDSDSENPEEKE